MWGSTGRNKAKEKAPKKKSRLNVVSKEKASEEKEKGTCGPKHQTPHIPFDKSPLIYNKVRTQRIRWIPFLLWKVASHSIKPSFSI